MNDLISRYTSRKFLLAIAATAAGFVLGYQDNILTQAELLTALSPILAFIGVEGYADAKTRVTNIPEIEDAPKGKR
jgi:hypothetical protein